MGLRTMLSRRQPDVVAAAPKPNGRITPPDRRDEQSPSLPISPVPSAITIPSGSRLLVQSWQDVWIPEDAQKPPLPGHCSVLLGLQGIKHRESRMTVFSTYVYCVSNAKEREKALTAVKNVIRDFEVTDVEREQLNQLRDEIEAVGDVQRSSVLCSQGEPERLPVSTQRSPIS